MDKEKAKMKHAVIASPKDENVSGRRAEAETSDGRTVCLYEKEYSQEELEAFRAEASKWIVRLSGSHNFLADSDSGEDATGYYRAFFDPDPERAVFENGKPVGFYLCTDGFRYSGNGRASFDITHWGFPGSSLFGFTPWGAKTHLFIFSEPASHEWDDWSLLEKDPEADYSSYLDF
ncbi:MAG: hypothetical protein J5772_08860 [Clostridia bacterium]|nr:hypothetical protein [Clostridia bacterium]